MIRIHAHPATPIDGYWFQDLVTSFILDPEHHTKPIVCSMQQQCMAKIERHIQEFLADHPSIGDYTVIYGPWMQRHERNPPWDEQIEYRRTVHFCLGASPRETTC